MTTTLEIANQIERRLKDTREALAEAREVLREVEVEEAALAKALRALAPGSPLVAKPERKAPEPPPKPPARKQVSDALVERVREIIADADSPLTVNEIAAQTDKSSSAVFLAVQELRSRQEVRLAGKASKPGAPNLFSPMNGATHE